MNFMDLKHKLQKNFEEMTKDVGHLFEVEVDKDLMWNHYLDSFPKGTNEIFRERREYDCSCCRQFIKNIGNAVIIESNKIKTIWDFEIDSPKYQPVMKAMSAYIKSKAVSNIYMSKFKNIGTDKNKEQLEDGTILNWEHYYLELPNRFVDMSDRSLGDIKGTYRDTRNVFKRSLDEISLNSLLTVLELISQNSLYKGEEWQEILSQFLSLKKEYLKLQTREEEDNYAWEQSVKVGAVIGRIKNHSIGTLLINISEGMELDLAVKKYEDIVAPENYRRSKPIFTKKMLEDAQKTVKELGFEDSLGRRHAVLDDISVNDILFSNKDSAKQMADFDVFAQMSNEITVNPKKYSKVEEISIEDFINNVLPKSSEVEVLLESKHQANMVSLTAPINKDSKSMFKWENGFGWAYSGNIADSSMKDNVKSAGGKIDGVLRFSIQWNDGSEFNPNDFDAHCIEPCGNHIYYGNRKNHRTTGELDVDITSPKRGIPAVENITFSSREKMEKGVYEFYVHNFSHNGGRDGFKAEIEFNGEVHTFEYGEELRNRESVEVAEVTFDKTTGFTIESLIPSNVSSREIWGLNSNQFVPVSTIMFSPNHWEKEKGIGNKHYFFMLKNCVNEEQPNSMFNEFLKEDLLKHKRVFEALSAKMRVENSDNQLSGIGFSSTRRNELTVKVKGSTERILKVKF